jgi:hypothetical protein
MKIKSPPPRAALKKVVKSQTPTDNQPPAPQPRNPQTNHRRTGKVAVLPKDLRDKVNLGIQDGLIYAKIIQSLGEPGKHLTDNNISEWVKCGGHEDWLKDKFWREKMEGRLELFTDMYPGKEPAELPRAGLQLAATGKCELLREFCKLIEKGTVDAKEYVMVANSLARISRVILLLQQHRDERAKDAAQIFDGQTSGNLIRTSPT